MKTKTRKQRSDSTAAAVARFKNLDRDLSPPKHTILHEGAEPFYVDIVECRAPDMWNAVDLTRAVELANTQLAIKTERAMLLEEGSVISNPSGTPMQNPRAGIVNMHLRAEISMAKQLQTDAINTQGRNIEVKKRNQAHNESRQVAKELGGDPLLMGLPN